jgi:hypothetical protein
MSIGVGHAEREFEILGVPFHERGRVTDEYLAAMIELWTSDEPEYHGRFVDFADVVFDPKPVQQPHPPIWVGGNSKAAMRRAARHDGWYPWLIAAADLPAHLEYLWSLPELETRTSPFDVCMPLVPLGVDEQHRRRADVTDRTPLGRNAQAHVDAVGELAELGVTWTSVAVPSARSLDEHLDGLRWLADVFAMS